MSLALGIQHKMHRRHIVTCGLPGCTTLLHIISQTARDGARPALFLCCSTYCLFCVVLCTVLLPPGGYPIAVNKYIIYHIISYHISFSGGILNIQCVFWFSLQILSEIFLIPTWNARDIIINLYWSSCYYCQLLMKHEFSPIVFRKISEYQNS